MDEEKILTLLEKAEKIREEIDNPAYQELHFFKYLEWKASKERRPISGMFELTPKCNLNCGMCYININHSQIANHKLMPIEKWKWLADEAQGNGMMNISLTGGECLTYPGFDELYTYLHECGIRIVILTNGVLMDPNRVKHLKRYPPKVIRITLYGGSEDEYEKVTGYRVFEKVFWNIQSMREAGLPVALTLTPNPFSGEDQHRILECADSLGVPYSINSALIPPRANTGRKWTFDTCSDHFIEICRTQCKMRQMSLTPVNNTELPAPGWSTGEVKRGLLCEAGKSIFTIQYDGKMCPCSGLDEITTKPLEDGFREAWEELKAKTDDYLRPAECDTCYYRLKCQICPAVHKEAPEGHCDRRICERTMQMIREGIVNLPEEKRASIQ